MDAIAAPFLVMHRGDALREAEPLLRHRSLRLEGEGGLIDATRSDAVAKGWQVVSEITINGTVLYHSLGLMHPDGHRLLMLAFGDAVAPRRDNPGASFALADEVTKCPEADRLINLAPCHVAGCAPVWVWTNLPAEVLGAHPWLGVHALLLPGDAATVWSTPPTWEQV